MSKKPIIFCDFDGTITQSDNIVSIMKHFAPPEWETLKDKVLSQSLSVKEGVGKMFSLLPSTLKEEIIRYVKEIGIIRAGFAEFIAHTKEQDIPLYIVSGGIDFFVYPILDPYIDRDHIYCNASDFSKETIDIIWPHACDAHCSNDCGCCKPSILRQFDSTKYEKIVIGDSITDLQAAKLADRVYARDFLIQKCEELQIPYTPFEQFTDIIQDLKGVKPV
ncbi:2-hydroxy-3-keto-5-methylthiopentenyl-1-phosphate phosphatase [Shimazuella sp. AN120528]|uniref:2-hydroxy-3-keto-5-methylthiopentenyl-1- phosphate phosphatase n=1 Tax=Shimazuella soli TaxID=1892854 RepID=UPI001F109950|nr:2-hydroxy-3-keto-5-methylthiopentenyl-1-phosphate phosphatase [Shimazuella soli]MCH5583988.1 2-hydroxy-3-keto-5-methylthiopentenyl-1-phosphate phosphatase [Shimazuella soli]